VVDTIKEITGSNSPAGLIRTRAPVRVRTTTLDRSRLWAMETPQAFARDLIVRAYARVESHRWRITDDVQAVEHLGAWVSLLENQHPNPKADGSGRSGLPGIPFEPPCINTHLTPDPDALPNRPWL